MNNWKIGQRIGAGFAVVLLISASLGLFAFLKVRTIDTIAAQIVGNSLPSVYIVGQIRSGALTQKQLLLKHLATHNQDEMRILEAEVAASRTRNSGFIDQYRHLLSNEREQALFENLQSARAKFTQDFEEFLGSVA